MSFTTDVKNELSAKRPSERHAEAEILGMLLSSRSFSYDKILFQTGSRGAAECFVTLLRRVFGCFTDLSEGGSSRPTFTVSVSSAGDRSRIMNTFGIKRDEPLTITADQLRTEGGVGAFLRGVFLATGAMSDPEKEYRIEFSFKEKTLADAFAEIMTARGMPLKITLRQGKYIVYTKDSTVIEDLLTLMGAGNETLNLINVKIYKSMKNKINRKNNCETRNILKSANAAFEQTVAIKKLKAAGRLELLPDELIEVAALRLANPEASLSELSRISGNRITRSGISHRLKRIMEIAEEVK